MEYHLSLIWKIIFDSIFWRFLQRAKRKKKEKYVFESLRVSKIIICLQQLNEYKVTDSNNLPHLYYLWIFKFWYSPQSLKIAHSTHNIPYWMHMDDFILLETLHKSNIWINELCHLFRFTHKVKCAQATILSVWYNENNNFFLFFSKSNIKI